jgi:hypothetical protein
MRIRGFDTETFLIGPGSIFPKLVCLTIAERMADGSFETAIYGNGDKEIVAVLREMFQVDGNILVAHSASYDLCVIALSYPEIEPLIWAKLEAGEITDTLLRERLLNLSRHGKLDNFYLPDGSSKRIGYHLSDLVLSYIGTDLSALKEGDDIWRLRYSELDGLKASSYPTEARDYAISDAVYALQVYEKQAEDGGSVETEFFQTAADYALALITAEGMPIDPVRFGEVQAMLLRELSAENLFPLVAAGIITPEEPARPHARQLKKAVGLIAEWTGETAPTNDTFREWRDELESAGIKFKAPEPSHCKTDVLQQRVLAALVAVHIDPRADDVDRFFKMDFEELKALAEELQVNYSKTPGGDVSTASEVIDETAPLDEILLIYQHRQNLQKLVTTELPRMTWNDQPAERVHPRFTVLVETGRTSSRAEKLYPSFNGQNVDPRARPIFVPPPGYLLCSTDYSTLELVCVGQTMFDKYGYSIHADKINAGYDLHAYLGTQLAAKFLPSFRDEVAGLSPDDAYEFFKLLKESDPKTFKHFRKFAKPVGLGFPGGLGPYKIITLAKKTYDVDIIAEAVARFETNPEEFDRQNPSVLYYAKKLYGMDRDDTTWTPVLKGICLARTLKDIWLDTYPEMIEFFDELNSQRKKNRGLSDDGEDSPVDDFSYTTPFGMVRNGCSYTSAANGEAMQSPAAEGFKSACFNLVRATRDPSLKSPLFRPAAYACNEIHDETLTFLREPDAHDLAMEVKDVMEQSMRLVIRDVTVKAEPCLMRRWFKEAEPVYEDGKLVPWEPAPSKT